MRFLERNLEDIIWHELEYCRERGLNLEPMEQQRFRQLNLAPLGVADIVHMGFHECIGRTHIQIIECKKDIVNVATYAQASRYQTAIEAILGCCDAGAIIEKVLIGQRIDPKGDFWHLIRQDNAIVFTYEYKHDGIHFKKHTYHRNVGCREAYDVYLPTTNRIAEWVTAKRLPYELLEE